MENDYGFEDLVDFAPGEQVKTEQRIMKDGLLHTRVLSRSVLALDIDDHNYRATLSLLPQELSFFGALTENGHHLVMDVNLPPSTLEDNMVWNLSSYSWDIDFDKYPSDLKQIIERTDQNYLRASAYRNAWSLRATRRPGEISECWGFQYPGASAEYLDYVRAYSGMLETVAQAPDYEEF